MKLALGSICGTASWLGAPDPKHNGLGPHESDKIGLPRKWEVRGRTVDSSQATVTSFLPGPSSTRPIYLKEVAEHVRPLASQDVWNSRAQRFALRLWRRWGAESTGPRTLEPSKAAGPKQHGRTTATPFPLRTDKSDTRNRVDPTSYRVVGARIDAR